MNQRIASAATIHANRLRNCIMPSDKDMEKEGKATIVIKTFKSVDVTLCNIKGFDNWAVSLLTTYEVVEC